MCSLCNTRLVRKSRKNRFKKAGVCRRDKWQVLQWRKDWVSKHWTLKCVFYHRERKWKLEQWSTVAVQEGMPSAQMGRPSTTASIDSCDLLNPPHSSPFPSFLPHPLSLFSITAHHSIGFHFPSSSSSSCSLFHLAPLPPLWLTPMDRCLHFRQVLHLWTCRLAPAIPYLKNAWTMRCWHVLDSTQQAKKKCHKRWTEAAVCRIWKPMVSHR